MLSGWKSAYGTTGRFSVLIVWFAKGQDIRLIGLRGGDEVCERRVLRCTIHTV